MLRLGKTTKVVLGAGALVGTWWLACSVYETWFYRRALPAALETTGLVTAQSDASFLSALLAFQREACGGALHGLSVSTRRAIERQGLAFFATASHGRGYPPGHPQHHYYSYRSWQETPVPHAWISEGIWSGLNCMKLDRATVLRIKDAATRPGSFYSTKDEAEILVVPSLELVVFTYFG